MRLFRKAMCVCQNCKFGNNNKGEWKKRNPILYLIKRNTVFYWAKGFWHIYCEKKEKYFIWDTHKKCFEKKIIKLTHEEITKMSFTEIMEYYHLEYKKEE
jgi:hypothetical protein